MHFQNLQFSQYGFILVLIYWLIMALKVATASAWSIILSVACFHILESRYWIIKKCQIGCVLTTRNTLPALFCFLIISSIYDYPCLWALFRASGSPKLLFFPFYRSHPAPSGKLLFSNRQRLRMASISQGIWGKNLRNTQIWDLWKAFRKFFHHIGHLPGTWRLAEVCTFAKLKQDDGGGGWQTDVSSWR